MNNYQDNNSLTLNLGFPTTTTTHKTTPIKTQQTLFEPTLTLSLLSRETYENKKVVVGTTLEEPPCSAISSLSTVVVSVKRERETASSDDVDIERGCSRISDEDEDGGFIATATRKKLRLNKQQSAMLEDSFKEQSTLNPKQKQALAERLNLRPRQVEVWFQNRRARTKLKQTEVDYEYLKKYCESLSDENRRLEKELHELKALKVSAPPFYMHLPAATLTMCPSCERVGGAAAPNMAGTTVTGVTKNMFSVGPKTHRFIAPLLVDN